MFWQIKRHNLNPDYDCPIDEFDAEVNKMHQGLDALLKVISISDKRCEKDLIILQNLIMKDMNSHLENQNIGRFEILIKFADRIFPVTNPYYNFWLLADQVFHQALRLPFSESIVRNASIIGAELIQSKSLLKISLGKIINAIVSLIRTEDEKVLRNLIQALDNNLVVTELFEAISGLLNFIQVSPLVKKFVDFVKKLRTFMETENEETKIQKAHEFMESYPTSVIGYKIMATILLDQQKYTEALPYADKILNINSFVPTYFLLKYVILDHLGR